MNFYISRKLAYETGVHIGDGNLYSKRRTHKITYSGNLRDEEVYYLTVLKPLLYELYNKEPSVIREKSRNSILLVINSKEVAEFKIYTLNLPNGKKNHITIPDIIKQNETLLLDCIKGIGDTDFSLSFKKNRKGIHAEPRIELFTRSKELVLDLYHALLSFGFTASIELDVIRRGYLDNRLRIYGKRNLELWMQRIGFSNPYRIVKYQVYKKFGYGAPKQSYNDLLFKLNSQ